MKTTVFVVFAVVMLLVVVVVYYNALLNDRDSKIASLNSQLSDLNDQLSNLKTKVSNLSDQITNFTTANLVTAIGITEVPKDSPHNASPEIYNHLYISGSVNNTGRGIAYNSGLHVLAYDNNGVLKINMTVPLAGGKAAFGTDSEIIDYLGGSSSGVLRNLGPQETTGIDVAIFHRDTVSSWTITPVWTNFP
jgi:hypothetical protein